MVTIGIAYLEKPAGDYIGREELYPWEQILRKVLLLSKLLPDTMILNGITMVLA